MVLNNNQQQAIEWAINELKKANGKYKTKFIDIIFLSLDIFFLLLIIFFTTTTILFPMLSGVNSVFRFVQSIRFQKLQNALKPLTMVGIAYIIARKKRSEFMTNIKIRNWIIAGLNAVAIIMGVVLVFVEPNAITDNIIAVIMGLAGLLGVNIAIPCFNNAKTTEQEKLEIAKKKELKLAQKQAKAKLKEQNKLLLEQETQKIIEEQEQAKTSEETATIEVIVENK